MSFPALYARISKPFFFRFDPAASCVPYAGVDIFPDRRRQCFASSQKSDSPTNTYPAEKNISGLLLVCDRLFWSNGSNVLMSGEGLLCCCASIVCGLNSEKPAIEFSKDARDCPRQLSVHAAALEAELRRKTMAC